MPKFKPRPWATDDVFHTNDTTTDPAPEITPPPPPPPIIAPEIVRTPLKNPKSTWTVASGNHSLGIFIDKYLGSDWISYTTKELQDLCAPEFSIEDILEFSSLTGVKMEKQKMQAALNALNSEASIAKNLQEGQDLGKIKQAKQLTSEAEDSTVKYIWGFVPSSLDTIPMERLQVTCPNCEIEFIIPELLKGSE